MKKYILIFMAAVSFAILGLSDGEAWTYTESPFPLGTPDNTITYDISDLGNGVNHGLIFTNQAANTASLVVLDSNGLPDDLLLGYTFMAADYNLGTIDGTTDASSVYTSPYPAQAPDIIYTYSTGELNGYNHAVMFYNQFSNTAMLIVLDPEGVPDSFYMGYPFWAADFNAPGGGTIWYSANGFSWRCSSGCP